MAMSLELKKYELDALLLGCGKDVTRKHLASILFDGPNGVCVTTDGWRLHLRSSEPFDGRFLVARHTVELVARLLGKKGTAEFSADSVTVFDADGVKLAEVIPRITDAQFPPYANVLEGFGANSRLAPIGLSPKLVTDACKVFMLLPGWNDRQGMVLFGSGALDCVELVATDLWTKADWHVVVMPMRIGDDKIHAKPAALKARLLAKAAADKATPAKPAKKARVKK